MRLPLAIIPSIPGHRAPRRRRRESFRFERLEDRNLLAGNLTADLLIAPPSARVGSGEQVEISWQVTNTGDEPITNDFWFDSIYLSDDTVFDASDELLVFESPGAGPLNPNESYTQTLLVTIPNTVAGNRNVIVVVNDSGFVAEDPSDNVISSAINLIAPDVDLTIPSAGPRTTSVVAGQLFAFDFTLENLGTQDATAPRTDRVYLSEDDFFDLGDRVLFEVVRTDTVAGSSSSQQSYFFQMPLDVVPGSYFLFVGTDETNEQFETNDFNNGSAGAIEVTTAAPNLFAENASIDSVAVAGQVLGFSYSLRNNEIVAAAEPNLQVGYYLSDDDVINFDTDILLAYDDLSFALPFDAGAILPLSSSAFLPPDRVGNQFLLIVTDVFAQQFETDESDNVLAVPIVIDPPLIPDLRVTQVDVIGTLDPGKLVDFSWSVENQGQGDVVNDFTDRVYLSTDEIIDASDILIAERRTQFSSEFSSIGPGNGYTFFENFQIPELPGGTYFILVKTDALNEVAELDDEDVFSQSIVINSPKDLAISNVSVSSPLVLGSTITVTYTLTNNGSTPIVDPFELFYLSDDAVLDASDIEVTPSRKSTF
jgi:hypothetical protein